MNNQSLHAKTAASQPTKAALYEGLRDRLRKLSAGQTDFLANISNFAALLFTNLPDLNWAGFYLLRGTDLVRGPFQGKPACSCISLGDGVCGTAALKRAAILVPDVHAFPGHIVCDEAYSIIICESNNHWRPFQTSNSGASWIFSSKANEQCDCPDLCQCRPQVYAFNWWFKR